MSGNGFTWYIKKGLLVSAPPQIYQLDLNQVVFVTQMMTPQYGLDFNQAYNLLQTIKKSNGEVTDEAVKGLGIEIESVEDYKLFVQLVYNVSRTGMSVNQISAILDDEHMTQALGLVAYGVATSASGSLLEIGGIEVTESEFAGFNLDDYSYNESTGKLTTGGKPVGETDGVGGAGAVKGAGVGGAAAGEGAGVGAGSKLTGSWQNVNEAMSDTSRAYQTQVTGRTGQAWVENGVKFDGMSNGHLIEVKGDYSSFVNKNTGQFQSWFNGKQSLIDQATRQINAAGGNPIDWYFMDQTSMNAVKNLFGSNINGINFILQPLK